jgi:hypothetical protein
MWWGAGVKKGCFHAFQIMVGLLICRHSDLNDPINIFMKRFSLQPTKFVKDIFVAFFGVTAALLVNSLYEGCKKTESYNAMCKSIIIEAEDNRFILKDSWNGQIKDLSPQSQDSTIIYRDLKTNAVENYLLNENFMSNVPKAAIPTLSEYILTLRRMNAFRSAYQRYLEDKHNNFLLYHIRNAIVDELESTDSIAKAVAEIDFRK